MEKDRYWTFLIYPESAPENWKQILQETGLPVAISPIHNKDKNPDDEIKKDHYHILLCFNGPTTFRKVNTLCAQFNSPIPKRVLSVKGIYRYFTHKDNPEKYQYDEKDIQVLNGFDIKEYAGLTTSQIIMMKRELINIIKANNIQEYCILLDFLDENDFIDFFEVASSHTLFLNTYITSRRNMIKNIVDKR